VVLISFASLFSIRHSPCESQNIESDTLIILRSIEPWQRPASASRANLGRSNLNNRWHETAPPVGLPYPSGMLLLTGLAPLYRSTPKSHQHPDIVDQWSRICVA
jgi:hypothetical protein